MEGSCGGRRLGNARVGSGERQWAGAPCGTLTTPTATDADAAVAVSPYRTDRAQSALPLRKRARSRVVSVVSGNPDVPSRPARQLPVGSAGPLDVEDWCS